MQGTEQKIGCENLDLGYCVKSKAIFIILIHNVWVLWVNSVSMLKDNDKQASSINFVRDDLGITNQATRVGQLRPKILTYLPIREHFQCGYMYLYTKPETAEIGQRFTFV